MVSPLTYAPRVTLAYLRDGERGLSELADRLESTAHERPDGKFGKVEARYLPQSPFLPTLWRHSCGRCRFWEEGAPGEPGTCHVVGREGDPFGGEAIHYRGWCGFWTPPEGEPGLAWLHERLHPTGRTDVRGEYLPPLTEREERRRERPPDVTREVAGVDARDAGPGTDEDPGDGEGDA